MYNITIQPTGNEFNLKTKTDSKRNNNDTNSVKPQVKSQSEN